MKKTIISVVLLVVTLLSTACGAIAPVTYAPTATGDLSALTATSTKVEAIPGKKVGYLCELTGDAEKDAAIWTNAAKLYEEWKVREAEILAKGNATITPVNASEADFKSSIYGQYSAGTMTKYYKTRTLSSLSNYTPKATEFDEYGGWKNDAMRQEATGHFYTKKIDGRWWFIDPLGYPFILSGMAGMTYQYAGSNYQKEVILKKYGDYEKWAIAATLEIKEFHVNARSVIDNANPYLRDVQGKIPYIDKLNFVQAYESYIGGYDTSAKSGSTILLYGMHVFDPRFETYSDEVAKSKIMKDGYHNDPYFIGYATDNEIPVNSSMFTQFLAFDTKDAINHHSYAAAWTFLAKELNKEDPTYVEGLTAGLNDKFRGFVYDRYFSVAATAIRKYAPDALILGSRALNDQRESEWLNRASAYWCDVLSFNWYVDWTPDANALNNISKWTDKPFIITEFFAKGEDACVGVAAGMTNNLNTISPVVKTQADRGKFYQNYTLRLLSCKNVAGWLWFMYTEATPGDGTSKYLNDTYSNMGLYSNDHVPYTVFAEYVTELNQNKYNIAMFFDGKK